MGKSLAGQVVAVTGGARGIGREIARRAADAGARVAIGDRDVTAARTTAEELAGDIEAFDLDVTDTDSFTTFLRSIDERWGRLDVLVNNAGVMWVGEFDQEPEAAARRQFDVNLHGVIRGVKLAAPAMRTRGHGHIVTIASAASKVAPPGEATYAATKHAVHGYLTAVRAELRGSGVHLSVVMPGVVDTELAAGTSSGALRRLRPEEVAAAVLDVIARPRFEVYVPRRIALLTRAAALLPQAVRDRMFEATVPNQVAAAADKTARHSYESRNLSAGAD